VNTLLTNHKILKASIAFSSLLPASALAASTPAACNPVDSSQSSNLTIQNGVNCGASTSNAGSLFGQGGLFNQIANILIFLVGAIAVIMLILGGLQYVISNGDSKRVESAKNTILYAIIGIVVAIMAYAAVAFVTGSLAPGGAPQTTG
jgi:cytochrome bd-type quinol oxidase subunit 2